MPCFRGRTTFKTKTLNLLAHQPDDRYIPYVADLLNSPSRVVRNMARAALKKTGRFPGLLSGLKENPDVAEGETPMPGVEFFPV